MSHRDMGIRTIKAREGQCCYGMGLGIMILDEVYPAFPGDVRNASAYPFPIQYEIVEGVDIQDLLYGDDLARCLAPVEHAARKLERLGCRAIAAECGYFAYFQREIAALVDVPVFMSSLLQVPFAQQLIGPDRVVGLVVARESRLTERHLKSVGIVPGSNYVVSGVDHRVPEFDRLWHEPTRPDPPAADYDKAEGEFLTICIEFYRAHTNMGAMVLECTGMQPFARALQREIDIPIFTWGTLLDYAYSVVVHRDYYGHV